MGEYKFKKPGEFKGLGYRKEQKRPIRARWAFVAELGSRWPERHVPGYLERKRKIEAEKRKKEARERAEAARKDANSPEPAEDTAKGDRPALVLKTPELTPGENHATIGGEEL